MIRPAKHVDIPRLVEILVEAHGRSVYAERPGIEVDVPHTKSLLVNAIQRHGQKIIGGTYVAVAEKNERVEGFILGGLERIQCIGTALYATDLMWICTPQVDARDPARLLEAMIGWAESVPKCREIIEGATRVVGDYARVEKMLKRRGFSQFGVIYAKEVNR